jgi:hypothetical protein
MSKVFDLVDDDSIIFRKKIEELNNYLDSLGQLNKILLDKMEALSDCNCMDELFTNEQKEKFINIKDKLEDLETVL